MGEHVLCEVLSTSAREGTLRTPESLLSRMDHHVFLEVTSLCAGEVTLCAAERLFA